ncbi:hypothetical protein AB6A40_005627 [Gnathostoma spinigerum]|uniref:Uncharacterized protein n=1 Tax=Gnathostoma spinigerum TaxID=75299 RepID=A0ABD6EG53_9BILA
MKVFTVGLDEKPPLKEGVEKEPIPLPAPSMIAIEKKKNCCYKGYLLCLLTVFFALILAIALTEMSYIRSRDESFLNLRWVELQERIDWRRHQQQQAYLDSINRNYYAQPIANAAK